MRWTPVIIEWTRSEENAQKLETTLMANRKAFSITTIKIVWGASGAVCAFPNCGQRLIAASTDADPSVPLGEMAHIVGHSELDGPRKDPSYPREKIDLPENSILLCPTHHTLVDKQDATYSVEDICRMKRAHEAKVQARLERQVLEVKSQDFEQLLHHLVDVHPGSPSAALPPTPPEEKMRRNDLTDAIRGWLNVGLAASHRVETYIKHTAVIDSKYPERLRDTFRKEYDRLGSQGFHGDSLFLSLLEWMQQGRIGTPESAAVYPVIAHLFQTCELFEP